MDVKWNLNSPLTVKDTKKQTTKAPTAKPTTKTKDGCGSTFGCCLDGLVPALGPGYLGCPGLWIKVVFIHLQKRTANLFDLVFKALISLLLFTTRPCTACMINHFFTMADQCLHWLSLGFQPCILPRSAILAIHIITKWMKSRFSSQVLIFI